MHDDLDATGTWGEDSDDGNALDSYAATARVRGRVARVDRIGEDLGQVQLWLAVEDIFENEDGTERTGWQAIKVRAIPSQLWQLTNGAEVELTARYNRGQLKLLSVESVTDDETPVPDVKLPAPKILGVKPDGRLPSMEDLTKATKDGWGRLNHSIWRHQVPIHLCWATKARKTRMVGWERPAQGIIREIAEREGVEVIAVAFEQHSGTHLHLLVRHPGPGTPPTWQWPHFVNRVKALSSRQFKRFEPDFEWQAGYALAAVHGGRQGAEQALAAVRAYVENQGVQGEAAEVSAGP